MVARNKAIKDEDLAGILEREIASAMSGTESNENAAMALDYYFGRPLGDEKPGRSATISMDVADMVNAIVAMILPMIGTDSVVTFEPNGQSDEIQARAESDIINKIILEDNHGVIELQEAVKDALLLRNGWTKIFIDEDVEVDRMTLDEPFIEMSAEELGLILQSDKPNEVREMEGEATIKRTVTTRTFRMEAVPKEFMLYQANANTMDLDKLRFVAERQLNTRSELVELGLSKAMVYDLPAYGVDSNQASSARNRNSDTSNIAETPDQDEIECYLCFLLIDLDGDGVSERWQILTGGDRKSVV